MFKVYDDFRSCDENRQPYSFSVERHTETANMHAWVKEDKFYMASVGNRYILNTPKFVNGVFDMDFRVTYMAEFNTDFIVCFGYDERTRTGYAIRFVYDLKNTVNLSLVRVSGNDIQTIEQTSFEIDNPIMEDVCCSFSMKLGKSSVSGCVAGVDYCFSVNNHLGKIALERANFIGELILENVSFTSSDKFETEPVIKEVTAEIPCINGGDIPYRVTWSINKTDGEFYLTASLDGGTKTRKVDRTDRPGQYVAEKDWMKSPYIGLGSKHKSASVFYLANGEKAFIDPNIYWDCQKDFFSDTDLPLVNTYKVSEKMICDDLEVIFGYENLFCSGYDTQKGGSEFHFSPDGKLLCYGEPVDGRDIFELYSKKDKYALSFIPDDCYNREDVIEHIKYNHYFDVDEDIEFTFVMKTVTDTDYLDVKASLLNVYETDNLIKREPDICRGKWDYGYNMITAKVCFPKMNVGVYKAEFLVYFGGSLYKRYVKVFEVYDKALDVNPALAVGLPFTFSMPNEQKRLMRNAFDLWNPIKSCDLEHYYNCITDTPEEAQIRKSWLLSKPFKREWFSWIGSRTCNDWSLDKYIDVVKNCDYLFCSINEKCLDLSQSSLYPIRQDHHTYQNFMMRADQRLAILDDFLAENTDIAKKIDYKPGTEFTYDKYVNLMKTCALEWIKYQNKAGLELIKKQNEELKKINPNIKRAIYGPVNIYTTPTVTNHSLEAYGNSDYKALSEDVFTGFAVFEDYPAACAYQTYRGAFAVMTILLHSPKLVIYPEQYAGSRGGCIDGAVKFAHAPMGGYDVKPYELSAHAFEFVFNTSYRLSDGYHYWNTYGFHRSPELLEDLVLDWKYVIENKPSKPLKSTAFLAEFSNLEDVFEVIDENKSRNCFIMNQSEMGEGLLYECSREAGVPNGFALTYDVLSELSADECDVLVLPSLEYAEASVIREIRRLYNEGVNLIAVSDISGLEDLFGVTYDKRHITLNCICYDGKREYVRENDALLKYKPNGAKVIMHSETGDELIMTNGRTMIINTSVKNLGSADSEYMSIASSLHIVGDLIREALKNAIKELSRPLALGENVGVTLFRTQDGRLELLAIDYTPFDNKNHDEKEAVIHINIDNVKDVKCEREIFVGRKDGVVREIRFKIRPHEAVFVELKEN